MNLNLFLGSFILLLIVPHTEGTTWNQLVDRITEAKNALTNEGATETIQPPPNPPRFLESIQHVDVTKLKAGLKKLNKRAQERQKKNGKKDQVDSKVMQRIQQKIIEKTNQAKIQDTGDSIHEINQKYDHDDLLYQKDIILSQQQLDRILIDTQQESSDENPVRRKRRQAEASNAGLWPNNQVFYYFDANLTSTARNAILSGIQFWAENTCVDFVESATAVNRIRFAALDGCYSLVGFIGGVQDLSIGIGCESMGTVCHEIGHALGFWHQMSRYDRDNYITLDYTNVDPIYYGQFDKETVKTNNNYGMPYDWASIMQYGASSASNNGRPSMIAKDLHYQDAMGSDVVAFYDVSMMNERYGCKVKCSAFSDVAICFNGGYPHPRNCSICMCPRGYGGSRCQDRAQADGCGDYKKASSSPQNLTVSLTSSSTSVTLNSTECSYAIYTDPGERIEVTIVALSSPACVDGCIYGGLEVKADHDVKMSGYRYCCRNDVGQVITSAYNFLPVINWSRYRTTSFTLSYRAVPDSTSSSDSSTKFSAPQMSILNNLGDGPITNPPTTVPTTTLKTTTTKTPTTKSRCQDHSKMCMTWQYYFNFCQTYPTLFKKTYCKKTCGLC
ncbi:unnamed protein product, partial [Mesorhabditis belari]|uniref:Zinc metalloproteinase n=1 Tax=Mesorhabditis belari TaxID=2138241 RepID=A0AAF3E951_9BILA